MFLPEKNLKNKYDSEWAFVNGSTGGLGEAICKKVASQKLNLLICGRNEDLLKELKNKIEKEFDVKVKYIIHDHSYDKQSELIEKINDIAKQENIVIGKNMNIFFLNAGYGEYMPIDMEMHSKRLMPFLNTNIITYFNLAVFFYSKLKENAILTKTRKKKGCIFITASLMGYAAFPNTLLYHCSKNSLTELARSMYTSGKNIKIDILAVEPGPLSGTKFYINKPMSASGSKAVKLMQESSFLRCSPQKVTKAMFSSIGCIPTRPVGWTSWITVLGYKIVPSWISTYVMSWFGEKMK